jgi:hypothetical protein
MKSLIYWFVGLAVATYFMGAFISLSWGWVAYIDGYLRFWIALAVLMLAATFSGWEE